MRRLSSALLGFTYAVILGLVGAGIVHIAILFLLPMLSERDAWSRLEPLDDLYTFQRVDGAQQGPPILSPADPLFRAAVCRFDLGDGSIHVYSHGRVPFWSASVYDRNGQNVYSLTDRAATDAGLDLLIGTPAQMIALRKNVPDEFQKSLFVETDIAEGIVLVRILLPDESWSPIVSRYMDGMVCEPA